MYLLYYNFILFKYVNKLIKVISIILITIVLEPGVIKEFLEHLENNILN